MVSIMAGEGRRKHVICNSCNPDDAYYILHCVNSHDQLVAALTGLANVYGCECTEDHKRENELCLCCSARALLAMEDNGN